MTYDILLASGVRHSDLALLNGPHNKASFHLSPYSYYNIVDYIPYSIYYISKTVIFIFFSSFCLVDVLRSCNIRWISRSMLIKTFCFIGKSQRHFQSFHTSQCIVCMCLRCVRHWGFGKFLLCLWSCASCRTLGGGPWTSGASNLWKREDYKHPFIPFIHSFYQYLLSTYCMPGTILSSGI